MAYLLDIWSHALSRVWRHRGRLVVLTFALWIPWNIATSTLLGTSISANEVTIPLGLALDALYGPFFGAAVLIVLANETSISWSALLHRALRMLPRFWLIDLKVSVIGLAVPMGFLYLGSAILLTIWPSYAVARGVMVLTVSGFLWTIAVVVAYVLAPAVLVSDTQSRRWTGRIVSPGWSMWAARRLVSGNLRVVLGVVVTGQLVAGIPALLPSVGAGVAESVADAVLKLVELLWWALIWELLHHCLRRAAPNGVNTA